MFYQPERFSFSAATQRRWHLIRDEMRALRSGDFMPWPEHSLYGSAGWDTFGLYAFGRKQAAGCALCPETARLVRRIPGMMMAGFSRLAPGARIKPHCGYEGYSGLVLRFHLGLEVPQGCAIRVGAETREWSDGECLIFDDSVEHEAWNDSAEVRTILLVDFVNPFRKQPLILNPQFTPELIRFIETEHLPRAGIAERLWWQVWRLANRRRA